MLSLKSEKEINMKVMVVGGGGREHAIIKKIKKSPKVTEIFALPGNGGIAADATCVDIGAKDLENIVKFAKENGIEFAIVAPDDPLVLGLVDLLKAEGEENIRIAYGTIVNDIKEVSKSYKEAKLALDVGKIFFDEKEVIAYSALGIGRLIYQLPIPLCKMFIKEIFENKSPDDFDEETLVTIDKFFENSLNVSETSRQLYIHRNTLVYRLDKLQKSTGLDLRVFEDAITFKIALMVVRYMKYMETLEY